MLLQKGNLLLQQCDHLVSAALRRTLASLAMQDTRDFAVVLGDDGSQQDYFAESRAYLAAHGITDVQTAKLIPNGGTVKNAQNALRTAATRWVLMLSPGDFLSPVTVPSALS